MYCICSGALTEQSKDTAYAIVMQHVRKRGLEPLVYFLEFQDRHLFNYCGF